MAELVWEDWPTGVSHTIYVDIYPKPDTTTLSLHVRAAMKGWLDPCDVQIEPGEEVTTIRDQQGYPAFVYEISFDERGAPSSSPSPANGDPKTRAVLATVQVITIDNDTDIRLMGSGSLVDPRGYVLTNRHVVHDEKEGVLCINRAHCVIKVGLLDEADPYNRSPERWYYASVVDTDERMDLAVLRLVATWEGDDLPIIGFPTMLLGNSRELVPGDDLIIVGFPEVGGSTVTITRGRVSGFVEGLIKTDANMSPGNSGGAALNAQYQLVGVPTFVVSRGFIAKMAYVRPIHDALPLLRRTSLAGSQGRPPRRWFLTPSRGVR
jgi:S1-C subfamily serine protease